MQKRVAWEFSMRMVVKFNLTSRRYTRKTNCIINCADDNCTIVKEQFGVGFTRTNKTRDARWPELGSGCDLGTDERKNPFMKKV